MNSQEQLDALQKAAQPLMDYLSDNHDPHTSVVVDSNRAELNQGIMSVNTISEPKD